MIHHLTVQNFKSLKDASIDLSRRNILIGPNMSGKTNFITVFKFLRNMVLPAPGVYGLSNAINSLGGFPDIAWRGGESPLVSIALEGDFGSLGADPSFRRWEYQLDFV